MDIIQQIIVARNTPLILFGVFLLFGCSNKYFIKEPSADNLNCSISYLPYNGTNQCQGFNYDKSAARPHRTFEVLPGMVLGIDGNMAFVNKEKGHSTQGAYTDALFEVPPAHQNTKFSQVLSAKERVFMHWWLTQSTVSHQRWQNEPFSFQEKLKALPESDKLKLFQIITNNLVIHYPMTFEDKAGKRCDDSKELCSAFDSENSLQFIKSNICRSFELVTQKDYSSIDLNLRNLNWDPEELGSLGNNKDTLVTDYDEKHVGQMISTAVPIRLVPDEIVDGKDEGDDVEFILGETRRLKNLENQKSIRFMFGIDSDEYFTNSESIIKPRTQLSLRKIADTRPYKMMVTPFIVVTELDLGTSKRILPCSTVSDFENKYKKMISGILRNGQYIPFGKIKTNDDVSTSKRKLIHPKYKEFVQIRFKHTRARKTPKPQVILGNTPYISFTPESKQNILLAHGDKLIFE
ncbi:hypothetical protein NO991_11890 [Pseudoalteromonas sp. DY56-GL22]|uniref:hypothetical protein n=1 Tax=Pseudoalteromonas sp. DY56-GL22 TaxID=2967126 RepID=UPI00352B878E